MAVDWSKLKLIDAISHRSDSAGVSAYARFYLLATDITSRPVRGDSAPASVSVAWKVDDVDCAAIAPFNYIVSCTFRPFLSIVGRTYQNLKTRWDIRYGEDMLTITEEILGVRKLKGTEDSTRSLSAYGLPEYHPSGKASTMLPYTAAVWNSASVVPAACPFTKSILGKYLGQQLKVRTFDITFYRDTSHGTVADITFWHGINGTIPTTFGVPNAAVSGCWQATTQEVTKVEDEIGNEFWRIQRSARHVPNIDDKAGADVKWDGTKCGGTWYWPTYP
jgi:hypothetical protein